MNPNANSACDNGSSCSGRDPLHTVGLGWRLGGFVWGFFSPCGSCWWFSATVPVLASQSATCVLWLYPPFHRNSPTQQGLFPQEHSGDDARCGLWLWWVLGFSASFVWHGTACRNNHGAKQSKAKIIIFFFFLGWKERTCCVLSP